MKATQALSTESKLRAAASGFTSGNSADPKSAVEPVLVVIGSGKAMSTDAPGVVKIDWQTDHLDAKAPPNVQTVDALLKKQIAAGRAAKLMAARKRLGARITQGVPSSLQEARLLAGLSQSDLAAKLETSQPRVALLEAGRENNPGLKTLRKLARVFNLDMNGISKLFESE
ncbi:MAG: hypothetical protein B7Z58_01825 [Acidiphilium sp. 37-64-53]|uniref:helix-turn-helix transcriptional regulator n=1 Tax=Acidiphilium TaxID=522 RepID=UPI000BD55C88|nr:MULTISPECIES: helix-turn-helix transcriptional regulator [Acidiphilium]OYW03935.1 MAG: hypothetical protein B7Z58_01825 [Acidiphilium sp. 37-64-53]OZB27014.1 MAG: hypothetical protein B7X49_11680 [Acidiphilium sp. 34-64-41]HQT83869.1 helix-turn-helix transcriptional regulator [Acidiphilium rubrum]